MTFVRWHYRAGIYVRSHHRRARVRVGARQTSLLPTVVHPRSRRDTIDVHDPLPLTQVAGQEQLPLGA